MNARERVTCVLLVIAHLADLVKSFLYSYFTVDPVENSDVKELRHFRDIPGPSPSLPIIGTQWIYWWLGPYSPDKMHLANEDKLTSYGPIVKEHFLWNYPVIHLYDKKDIEDVLKYPSKYPIRPDLEVQCVYRRSCPEKYSSVGMVNAQGQEWHNLRNKLAYPLMSPKLAEHTAWQVSSVSDEFISKLRKDRDDDFVVNNFEKYVSRLGLEVIVAVLLNHQLGALKDDIPPVVTKLIAATERLFEVCHETMYGLPLWKYFPSRSYRELIKSEDTIYNFFADFVQQRLDDPSAGDDTSVLDHILDAEGVDVRDKITMIIDLVSAGVDTAGNATIFLLNNILSNCNVKDRVYEELGQIFPNCAEFRPSDVSQLSYLRACITESLRLNPVTPNVARLLEKDFVFQGYDVPAGTLVICETWVASLQSVNYENPREFIPERWLNGTKNVHPFLTVPFGAGKRMCPGKRIAEQEMLVVASKLLLSFDMQFDRPVEQVYKFLISPKGPIKVTLKDRNFVM